MLTKGSFANICQPACSPIWVFEVGKYPPPYSVVGAYVDACQVCSLGATEENPFALCRLLRPKNVELPALGFGMAVHAGVVLAFLIARFTLPQPAKKARTAMALTPATIPGNDISTAAHEHKQRKELTDNRPNLLSGRKSSQRFPKPCYTCSTWSRACRTRRDWRRC